MVNSSSKVAPIVASLLAFAVACGPGERSKTWRLHVSIHDGRDIDSSACLEELRRAAARDPRIELVINDHLGNAEAQARSLSDHAALGDLVILLPPSDASLDTTIEKIHKAEHPIIVLGNDVGHENFAAVMLRDDVAIGRAAAHWTIDTLPEGGSVVVIKGNMSSKRSRDRHRGFLQGLAATEARRRDKPIKIVYEVEIGGAKTSTQAAMRDAMLAADEIDVVFAHTDEIAHGVYESIVAANRHQDVKIIGIGGHPDHGLS